MEDAHSFVYNFGGVHGQGFFSIFDGHAGKHAAEWCGEHFHDYLIKAILADAKQPVPDLLNHTFHNVDARLSQLAQEQGSSSGCTAVTCFLRLEDEDGNPIAFPESGGINPKSSDQTPRSSPNAGAQALPNSNSSSSAAQSSQSGDGSADQNASNTSSQTPSSKSSSNDLSSGSNSSQRRHSHSNSKSGSLLSSFAKRIRKASGGSASPDGEDDEAVTTGSSSKPSSPKKASPGLADSSKNSNTEDFVQVANSSKKVRRVLYTANVGDARAVLCRRGHAIRLTYDHKASDAQEAKRITDAGGFVMNNRVNAVLAVTRSLGDSAMKEFVVGAPYTTETALTDEDTFLIVACDGLWDVAEDQDAVDLVREVIDPQEAANRLLNHALHNFSTDNTSVMVIRFNIDGDAYCAAAAQARKSTANTSPPKAVQGSHRATAGHLPHEDQASKPAVSSSDSSAGRTDVSTTSSVADSATSHTAQAGSTSSASAGQGRSDTQGAAMQPVRSNESNTSTVSNAGSGTS